MPEINWSQIADDAEETPAVVLAEALGKVESRPTAQVVVMIAFEDSGDWYFDFTGGALACLGMVETVRHVIREQCLGEPHA